MNQISPQWKLINTSEEKEKLETERHWDNTSHKKHHLY